jgi:hypothetical protein
VSELFALATAHKCQYRLEKTVVRQDALVAETQGLLWQASSGLDALTDFGFTIAGHSGGHRGETLEMSSSLVLLTVSADWLEGEISVTVRGIGGPERALASVIDVDAVKALHLNRVRRGATAGMIETTLRKVAGALVEQAEDVLSGTPEGLSRLGVV